MNEISDIDCIVRVLGGEADSFGPIVERYSARVYALVARIVGPTAEAEDITQEVFVTAWRKLDGFGRRSQFSTWLYRIAYNTAISALRRRRLPESDVNDNRLAAVEDTDSDTAFDEADLAMLERALERLAPRERAVVELFYRQELSVAEVATITGMSESNVRVMLHRSRHRLAEMITEERKYDR